MPNDRPVLDEKLSHFEARAMRDSDCLEAVRALSVSLRFGDARDIEATIAMARLLREAASAIRLNG